jgi:oligopeptide transport system substrate-binding protein
MKRLLILLLILTVAGFAFAGGAKEGEKPKAEVVFTVANGAEPPTFDPSLSEDTTSHNILLAINEGLLVYDPKTNLGIPGVAESWTISPDGKTWTFKIRKNAKWSDGVAITAKTVVDSWMRTLNPDTASPYAWLMGMVVAGADDYNTGKAGPEAVKIRALDDYTFQMDMVGPLPYVDSMLPHSIFAIMPLHVIQKYGKDWTLPGNHVSNGAYILQEWKPQDHVTVVKNPSYWDAANVKIDKIVYVASDDNNTRLNMYLAGEADWMWQGIPLDQLDAVKPRADYHVVAQLATYFYEFNHAAKSPLQDVRVRKALGMAVDRQALVDKVTRGGQLGTVAMVPPMPGYAPAKGNPYNVEQAKKLLADAGFPGGQGFPKMTILYNTSEGHKKIAEFVQQQWTQNLNVSVGIENAEWKTVLARGGQQDFQILRMGWVGDYQDPNTFLELFITDGGQNYGKYTNPKFDELIRKAATMKPGADRFKALQDAESILIDQDQGIIPFYHYVNQDMIDTNVWGGWYPTVMGWHPPKFIFKK